jgi:tetratricopeptide (TPR) repeat protein
MGLIGFLTYLSIFVAIFVSLKRKLNEASEDRFFTMGFMAMTVAYIIHNAFIFDTSANFITFFSILGFISFMMSPLNKNKPERTVPLLPPLLANSINMIIVIIVAVLIYKTAVLPIYANYATTRAIIAGWKGDYGDALNKYKEAVGYDVPGKYDFRNRFTQYLLDISAGDTTKYPNYFDSIKLAIVEQKKNEADFPLDYLPKLYISRLYITLGKSDPKSPYNDEALKESLSALALSKTFVRTYFEVAQAYLNMGEYALARDYFQKAVDLNPNVGISHWYLGIVESRLGDNTAAKKSVDLSIKLGTSFNEADYLRIISMYLALNDYDKIVWAYQKLIALQPKNPKYFASLAVAYANVNKIDEAVAMARQAVVLDPAFATEANIFIKSLGR